MYVHAYIQRLIVLRRFVDFYVPFKYQTNNTLKPYEIVVILVIVVVVVVIIIAVLLYIFSL